jgi:hypothetical protein
MSLEDFFFLLKFKKYSKMSLKRKEWDLVEDKEIKGLDLVLDGINSLKNQNEALKSRVDSFEQTMGSCASRFNKLNKSVVQAFNDELPQNIVRNRDFVVNYFASTFLEDVKESLISHKPIHFIRYIYDITILR